MSEKITEEMIGRMESRCRTLIDQAAFNVRDSSPGTQSLEASILTDQLVWQILVPIIVGLTGGLLVEYAKTTIATIKSRRNSKEDIKAMIDKPVITIPRERYLECVVIVRDMLAPYGVSDAQAEAIVNELIKVTHVREED